MKSKELRLLLSRSGSRKLFIASFIAAVVSAVLVISHAVVLGAVIVGVIYRHPDTSHWIAALGGIWIFRSFFTSFFESWTSEQASQIKLQLREEVTGVIGKVKPISSTELSAILIKGVNSLDIYLGRFIPQLFSATLIPMAVITALLKLDLLSGIIAVLTLPAIPFFGALIGRYTSDSVSSKWRTLGTLSRYFEDSLQGFVTLKIFGRSKSQAERIRSMGDQYTDETMKVLKISFLSAFVLELAATISVALIAVSIGLRLVDGKITFLSALIILILAPEVYFPLRNAASLFHASADGSEILGRITSLNESRQEEFEDQDIDFPNPQRMEWGNWELNIPEVAQSRISKNSIRRGESVFISGDSGIGKSSFADNLLGFHFDSEVRIDGQLLTEMNVKSYRKFVGWIPQLPQLAPTSIREQFLMLNPLASDADIIEALNKVQLLMSELPQGLNTFLGGSDEKSSELSGGQLRKIAVARALMRKPAFIVADEPTADLDHTSAKAIMSALRAEVRNGAALICISHDKELLEASDRVIEAIRVEA